MTEAYGERTLLKKSLLPPWMFHTVDATWKLTYAWKSDLVVLHDNAHYPWSTLLAGDEAIHGITQLEGGDGEKLV